MMRADPFDNNGMDGIFMDEALHEVDQLVGIPPGWGDEAEHAQHAAQQQQLVTAGHPAGPAAGQLQAPAAGVAVIGRAATAGLGKLPAPPPVTDVV